jgi:hypothetical protein
VAGYIVLTKYLYIYFEHRNLNAPTYWQSGQQEVGGRDVAGRWDVVESRKPQECFYVHVVGLGPHRIPEKYQQVDVSFHNGSTDLLVTSVGSGFEAMDIQVMTLHNFGSGSTGSKEPMFLEKSQVTAYPFYHFFLFFIVRNQCNVHVQ